MMRSFMTLMIATALLAVSLIGPGRVQAAGSHTATGPVTCAIRFINGAQHCYAPGQVLQAEQRAPFAVRPNMAVARLLRLNLAQVIYYRSYAGIPRVTSISYLYGVLRSDYGRAPGNPRSLLISEYPTRYTTFVPKYTRTVGGARFEISQAALNHPYRPWGPWYLVGNFAHRNASFALTANIPQGGLIELASLLRRQG